MTLRHAAALALVGWYLMVPPLNGRREIDPHVSMSKWEVLLSADTLAACKQKENDLIDFMRAPAHVVRYCLEVQIKAAECVGADDPRLKPK
jgi:hypothetical protein